MFVGVVGTPISIHHVLTVGTITVDGQLTDNPIVLILYISIWAACAVGGYYLVKSG